MIKYIIIIPVILNCFLCKAQDTSWKKTLTTIVYELEKKYPSDTFLSGGFKLRETKDVHVFMNCTCPENELGMSKAYWAITWILHDKSNNVGDCACGDGSEARWGVRLYIDAFEFQNIEQAENEKKLVDYFVSTARNDLNPSSNCYSTYELTFYKYYRFRNVLISVFNDKHGTNYEKYEKDFVALLKKNE